MGPYDFRSKDNYQVRIGAGVSKVLLIPRQTRFKSCFPGISIFFSMSFRVLGVGLPKPASLSLSCSLITPRPCIANLNQTSPILLNYGTNLKLYQQGSSPQFKVHNMPGVHIRGPLKNRSRAFAAGGQRRSRTSPPPDVL